MKNGREILPQELPMQKAATTGEAVRDYEFDMVYDRWLLPASIW